MSAVVSLISGLLRREVDAASRWHSVRPKWNGLGDLDAERSARVHAQQLFQGRVTDGIAIDGEALFLIDHVPVRLGEIGLAIWEAAREGVTQEEVVSIVEQEHGPHPEAPRIVREAVDQMLEVGLLVVRSEGLRWLRRRRDCSLGRRSGCRCTPFGAPRLRSRRAAGHRRLRRTSTSSTSRASPSTRSIGSTASRFGDRHADVLVRPSHVAALPGSSSSASGWQRYSDFDVGLALRPRRDLLPRPLGPTATSTGSFPGIEAARGRGLRPAVVGTHDHGRSPASPAPSRHSPLSCSSWSSTPLVPVERPSRMALRANRSGTETPPGAPRAGDHALVASLRADVAFSAGLGELERYRGRTREYLLWKVASQGGTRLEEWVARVWAAPTPRAALLARAARAPGQHGAPRHPDRASPDSQSRCSASSWRGRYRGVAQELRRHTRAARPTAYSDDVTVYARPADVCPRRRGPGRRGTGRSSTWLPSQTAPCRVLNGVGSLIWLEATSTDTPVDVVDRVAVLVDRPPAAIRTEVDSFLADLVAAGLLETLDS